MAPTVAAMVLAAAGLLPAREARCLAGNAAQAFLFADGPLEEIAAEMIAHRRTAFGVRLTDGDAARLAALLVEAWSR